MKGKNFSHPTTSIFHPTTSISHPTTSISHPTTHPTGDSGGSMSFQETDGLYYIRGIVSVGTGLLDSNTNELVCDSTQYALLTDVAQYLPWIRDNWFRCEKSIRCIWIWQGASYCYLFFGKTLSAQDCGITLDEVPNMEAKGLEVAGSSESIPKFSNAVTKFENLEDLYLMNIHLKNVERSRLSVFRMIKRLNLKENEITQLDAGTFDDLTDLIELDVQQNRLKELHVDLFKELRNLENLLLCNNKIETLPDDIFRYNTKLVVVYLDGNEFKAIKADIFKELRNLQKLYLFSEMNEKNRQTDMVAAKNQPPYRPVVSDSRFSPLMPVSDSRYSTLRVSD